jgi:hypothetical protein
MCPSLDAFVYIDGSYNVYIMNNLVVQLNDNNNIVKKLTFLEEYYDGTESTYSSTMEILSTRYYWYSVPKKAMVRALRIVHKEGHQFKILPPGVGNCEFN